MPFLRRSISRSRSPVPLCPHTEVQRPCSANIAFRGCAGYRRRSAICRTFARSPYRSGNSTYRAGCRGWIAFQRFPDGSVRALSSPLLLHARASTRWTTDYHGVHAPARSGANHGSRPCRRTGRRVSRGVGSPRDGCYGGERFVRARVSRAVPFIRAQYAAFLPLQPRRLPAGGAGCDQREIRRRRDLGAP